MIHPFHPGTRSSLHYYCYCYYHRYGCYYCSCSIVAFSGIPVGGFGPKSEEINLTPSRTFLHRSGTLYEVISLEKTKFKICSSTPGGGESLIIALQGST